MIGNLLGFCRKKTLSSRIRNIMFIRFWGGGVEQIIRNLKKKVFLFIICNIYRLDEHTHRGKNKK